MAHGSNQIRPCRSMVAGFGLKFYPGQPFVFANTLIWFDNGVFSVCCPHQLQQIVLGNRLARHMVQPFQLRMWQHILSQDSSVLARGEPCINSFGEAADTSFLSQKPFY